MTNDRIVKILEKNKPISTGMSVPKPYNARCNNYVRAHVTVTVGIVFL